MLFCDMCDAPGAEWMDELIKCCDDCKTEREPCFCMSQSCPQCSTEWGEQRS